MMNPAEIKKKRSGNGRRKIEIKRIEEENKRQVCFSKRRQGLFKKARELSTLCGVEVASVVFSPAGKPYFFGQPSAHHVLNHFLNVVPNPASTNFSEPTNQDQSSGERFWWDIDSHSMGIEELRDYKQFLLKQLSVVAQAEQQCYFQAPEATMEPIETLPIEEFLVEQQYVVSQEEQQSYFQEPIEALPIEEFLVEQQSVVSQEEQQSYFQEPIEAPPQNYAENGEDDYFLCWEQDYDCLDIVPI